METHTIPVLSSARLDQMIEAAITQPQLQRTPRQGIFTTLFTWCRAQGDQMRAGVALAALVSVLAISFAQMPRIGEDKIAQDALGEISDMMTYELLDNLS